jgi:hypothetical protein
MTSFPYRLSELIRNLISKTRDVGREERIMESIDSRIVKGSGDDRTSSQKVKGGHAIYQTGSHV